MKQIKAFIRPNMRDEVIDAIESLPHVPGLTVSEVRGWGHPKGGGPAELTIRVKLEIIVSDDEVEMVVDCIVTHARTGEGHFGDGTIFISPINEAVRIRNGDRGEQVVRPKE